MAPDHPARKPVTADNAVAQILEWSRGRSREASVEMLGSTGSGRTGILLRVRDALPEAVWIDASGLSAEEVLDKILDAFGVSDPWCRRSAGERALRTAGLGDRPLIVANVQRAGRTRRSVQSSRVIKSVLGHLVQRADARVIVESHPDDRWLQDWLTFDVTASSVPPPGIEAARSHPAVHALAFAELRRTPVQVWSELARVVGADPAAEGDLVALAGRLPEMLEVEAGHAVRGRAHPRDSATGGLSRSQSRNPRTAREPPDRPDQ